MRSCPRAPLENSFLVLEPQVQKKGTGDAQSWEKRSLLRSLLYSMAFCTNLRGVSTAGLQRMPKISKKSQKPLILNLPRGRLQSPPRLVPSVLGKVNTSRICGQDEFNSK